MIYLVLAVACYVATSVSQKLASQRGLDAVGVNVVLRVSGVLLTAVLLAVTPSELRQPQLPAAGLIGLAGGVCAFVSGYAGLRALSFGTLNATWSLLRVSTVIPVLASILVWGELREAVPRELLTKGAGVLCLLAAMVLLGAGKRE